MKAGIYIQGNLVEGSLHLGNDADVLSERLKLFFENHSHGVFGSFLSFKNDDKKFYIAVHPCAAMIEFKWSSSKFILNAHTDTVGPGYHVYLIQLILKMGIELGITWTWLSAQEGNPYIKNRYFKRENFTKLQEDMLQCLKDDCKTSMKTNQEVPVLDFTIGNSDLKEELFAVSQLRSRTTEWIYKTAHSGLKKLQEAGKDYFIWWDMEADAIFFKRTGIALLNIDRFWYYSEIDPEKQALYLITACFEEAKRLDPSVVLPEKNPILLQEKVLLSRG